MTLLQSIAIVVIGVALLSISASIYHLAKTVSDIVAELRENHSQEDSHE